ncbi:MAG: glycogen/starch/alpha-glucan family phosphorylase [Alphaproteobacteria bacterium]|nr:glycogen/starch/alpha-glucan family phosphorylase [Alphaproteobacteria bacterium]
MPASFAPQDAKATPVAGMFLPEDLNSKDFEIAVIDALKTLGKEPQTAGTSDLFVALGTVLRNYLIPKGQSTRKRRVVSRAKHMNYLSIEYLPGSNISNALDATGFTGIAREVLEKWQRNPKSVFEYETDAGLGNGGLGRLASCFLDSLANLDFPAVGYGLLYKNGFFRQVIDKTTGLQIEEADTWMKDGNPFGMPREDRSHYTVEFYGGHIEVKGLAHDIQIASRDGETVNVQRLWEVGDIDVAYPDSPEAGKIRQINDCLYPNDLQLRLFQEHFFASLSVQDILARHLRIYPYINNLEDSAAIQLNDTHGVLASLELLRILEKEHRMRPDEAIAMARKVFFFTNHTLMPEASEEWDWSMFSKILPRHYAIVRYLQNDLEKEIRAKFAHLPAEEQDAMIGRIYLIKDGKVRMSFVAAYLAGGMNGVSKMHSELLKEKYHDFLLLRGEDFIKNCTNGISPRDWLLRTNPALAELFTEITGNEDWVTDLSSLGETLKPLVDDEDFRTRFRQIKRANKARFAAYVREKGGPEISPDAMFIVQAKRFHQYKRQFLMILYAVDSYLRILENPDEVRTPVVMIFGGKAAPAYKEAKAHIALINWLARRVNKDPRVGDKLKIHFVENYDVSKARKVVRAADLSAQLSKAGTEASGTGNMKFALNGALTLGTRDGANVEIFDYAGEENNFPFGHTKEELDRLDAEGYSPLKYFEPGRYGEGEQKLYRHYARLHEALTYIYNDKEAAGIFVDGMPINETPQEIWKGDRYKIAADFPSFCDANEAAENEYRENPDGWNRKAIQCMIAGTRFPSDNTIQEYVRLMWGIKPDKPDTKTRSHNRCRRPEKTRVPDAGQGSRQLVCT